MTNQAFSLKKQSGMTLIIAMIMLVMITLTTVMTFQMSRTSLDIVGNFQSSKQNEAAANSALAEAISTTRLFTSPDAIFLNPCGTSNARCYDINNDGTNDITVSLTPTPTCIQARPILNSSLDFSDPTDAACATGVQQTFGIQGAASGSSLCSDSIWNIRAQAIDNITQAVVNIVQGAAVRVSAVDIATSCP